MTSFDANAESDNYKVVIVKSRKYLITVDALLLPLKAFCNTFTVLDMISDQNNRFAFTYDVWSFANQCLQQISRKLEPRNDQIEV